MAFNSGRGRNRAERQPANPVILSGERSVGPDGLDPGMAPSLAPELAPVRVAGGPAWKSGVNGNFNDGTKWSTGVVPGGSDSATIGVSGTYVVTLSDAEGVQSLTLKASGATLAETSNAELNVGTVLSVTGGTLALATNSFLYAGTLSVGSGGVLAALGSNGVGAELRAVVSLAGTTTIASQSSLDLSGGGSLGGTIIGAGDLNLEGGAYTAKAASFGPIFSTSIFGTLSFSGASGTLHESVTTLDEGGTLAIATGTDITLSNTFQIVFPGTETQYGNGVTGPGTLTTAGSTTIFDSGTGANELLLSGGITWVNAGILDDQGLIQLNPYGTDTVSLVNQSGATLELDGADAGFVQYYGGTDTLSNSGTLALIDTSSTDVLALTVTNTGLITVAGGMLALTEGGTLGGTISGAGTLLLDSGTFTDSFATLAGTGTLAVGYGAVFGITASHGTISPTVDLTNNGYLAIGTNAAASFNGNVIIGAPTGQWTQAAFMFGPGLMTTSSATISNAGTDTAVYLGFNLQWKNVGTVTDSGEAVFNPIGTDTVSITNAAGASFNLTNDFASLVQYYGGTDSFNNFGTLAKTGGTGISVLDAYVYNSGTINVASGFLALTDGGDLGGTISGAGSLLLINGLFDGSDGKWAGTGNLTVEGATLDFTGATGTLATTTSVFNGGTLSVGESTSFAISGAIAFGAGSAQYTGAGSMLGGGTLTTTGAVNILDDGTNIELSLGSGIVWVNAGNVTDAGAVQMNPAGIDTVSIINTGIYNFTDDDASLLIYYTGTDSFTNKGTLTKSAGTGYNIFQAALVNTGVINIASGGLELLDGGNLGGTISGAGTLLLENGLFDGSAAAWAGTGNLWVVSSTLDFTLATGSLTTATSVSNGGTLSVGAGTNFVIAGALTLGILHSEDSAYMFGPGTLTTKAVTIIDSPGNAELRLGGSLDWANAGTVNDAGLIQVNPDSTDSATITNLAGGTFNLTTDDAGVAFLYQGSDVFSNAGTLAKTGGTGTSTLVTAIIDTGLINVATGTLALAGGGSLGGTLTGAGMLALTNGGFNASAAGWSGTGNLSIVDSAALDVIASGTLALATTVADGGVLSVDTGVDVTFSGAVTFKDASTTAGTVEGPGTLTTSGTTNIVDNPGYPPSAYLGDGLHWLNAGTVLDAGAIYLNTQGSDTVTIVNQAGANFDLTGNDSALTMYYGGTDSLTNLGTLSKTGGTGQSVIGSGIAITNSGLLSATIGTLSLQTSVSNTGKLLATGGGVLDLSVGTLTNLSGNTLIGGTYEADAHAIIELTVNTGVGVDDANIILNGAGSTIQAYNANTGTQITLDNFLAGIASGGTLSLLNGRNFTATGGSGTFTVAGLLNLGAETFGATTTVINAGGTFSGSGTVNGAVIDNGSITGTGSSLTFSGAISGTGAMRANSGAVIDLRGGGSLGQAVTGTGVLQLDGAAAFTLAGGAGLKIATVAIDSGATLSGNGSVSSAVTDSGTIVASGGKLVLAGAVTGNGALQAVSGATLDLTAGGVLTKAISGAGTLELGGAYTLGTSAPGIAAYKIDAGASLSGAAKLTGSLADSGTVTALGGTLTLAGALSGSGTLAAAAGSVLNLTGGGSFGGAITGAGTVLLAAPTTLSAGSSLSATSVIESASLTLGANASQTNGAGHGFGIAVATGKTVKLSGTAADSFTNAGSLSVAGGGQANVAVAFVNAGNVSLGGGGLAFLSGVTNTGTIDAVSGTLSISKTVAGTGMLEVGAGATLSLLLGAGAGQTTDFLSGTGLLDLAKPLDFQGLIDGFGGSDQIDLIKTGETGFSFSGGVLTVVDGSHTVASLHVGGSYTQASFSLGSDGHGGTLISFV